MSEETITEQNTSLPLGDDPTQPQRPSETTLLEANLYGERIAGRYLLLEAIGAGGMGQVYRAEHQATGGVVAVKLIHSELLTSPTAAQRFELEARHTASLNHPNVVKVFDCGRDGERLYLAMEYVPGRPLTELILDQGPLPWQRVVALTRQLLVALGHAHESEHRLIHRDVKPDNILVMDRLGQDDFVKVVDFGIAHALATASDTDHFAGSPQTMAPEQWQRSGRISPATDLYAVGCVTYTMLAGRQPFDHDSIGQMMIQHLMHAPPPLSEYARVNTPPPLIDWVRWLMHKPPERRPTSARQALESLEALAHGNPSPFLTSGANPIAQPPASPERGALPTFMGHFFGREPLMERLDTLLIRDHGRQVTIHGQGGLGKSRLAVEWGRQRREAFGGEVFFAALSEARTVEDICGEVARVLDVPLGQGDPVELLGHALHGHGRTLMILDNFEQITHHAADTLHRWYRLAPEAVFVVTCRHSLGLDVEQVLHITPLELPKEGEHDADTLALNGAVALFLDRARRVRPDLRWTDAAAADVAQLVRELDGLPLAIELAAARTRALSPKQLVERLDQRFRLLRSHTHHQGRQATLEATLAWSWDLLETWERAALVQCSVFQGPFALEAAEAVVDLSDMDDDPWVVDALEALLDKSLLHTTSRDRYDMYTAIRAYASQQEIPDLTPIPSARSRHMRFFARYGRPAFLNPLDSGRSPMDELGESLENLRGALSWALEHESMEEATCCALALGQYLVRRGPFQQGLDLLEQVLEHDRLSNDQRGALLCLLGHLAEQSGQLDRAVETFRAALDLPEDTHRGHALFKLGFAQLLQGNPDKAHQSMQQALAHARQHGDTRLEAAVLARLGAVHSRRRDNALALDAFETSLKLSRQCRDRRLESIALRGLGNVQWRLGQPWSALEVFHEGLALAIEMGDLLQQALHLYGLNNVHWTVGRFEACHDNCTRSLYIARRIGHRQLEWTALYGLGFAQWALRRFHEALATLQHAMRLAREHNHRENEAWVLYARARVLADQGEPQRALADLERAQHLAGSQHNLTVEILLGRGLLYLEQNDLPQARRCRDEVHPYMATSHFHQAKLNYLLFDAMVSVRTTSTERALRSYHEAHAMLMAMELEPPSIYMRLLRQAQNSLGDLITKDGEVKPR